MLRRHMDREIDKLKKKILALSAVVENSVQCATQALARTGRHPGAASH